MKIAITSDGPSLESKVEMKLGTAQYLIIVDTESWDYEAVRNPGASVQSGAGIQTVVLAVRNGVESIITGYSRPGIVDQLRSNGIEVLTGISGTVGDVIEKCKKGVLGKSTADMSELNTTENSFHRSALAHTIRSSARQFINILPILIGVVLLMGLFNVFISKDLLITVFSGNMVLDTLWGACFGSIFAGNPINSYVIGGELLKYGISLFAVTALIITWVTVGLVQLPAEIATLGSRFALLRNGISFVLSIPIAIITVIILNLIK
jgi:predicted Fe-Mo cluster-binding NifX family protein